MMRKTVDLARRLLNRQAATKNPPRTLNTVRELAPQASPILSTGGRANEDRRSLLDPLASCWAASEHSRILKTPRACTPEELRRMRFSAGPEPFTRTVVRAFPDGNRVQVFLIEEPAVQSAHNVSPN